MAQTTESCTRALFWRINRAWSLHGNIDVFVDVTQVGRTLDATVRPVDISSLLFSFLVFIPWYSNGVNMQSI